MTPRILFAVAVALFGVWYIASCATLLFSMLTGPFATLIVGIVLLFVARAIYRGGPGTGE
jgi:hypothetical protein